MKTLFSTHFGLYLLILWQARIFFQNQILTLFSVSRFLSQSKISEKKYGTVAKKTGYWDTDGWMDEKMYKDEVIGPLLLCTIKHVSSFKHKTTVLNFIIFYSIKQIH